RAVIDGIVLAELASELADAPNPDRAKAVSARNRMLGIVTKTTVDTVMAQVEMVCGPYRIVSLMSAEAAVELGLEPGVSAVASIKSTNVVVERP
ncbi:molybdopterin-binding protein, partial [Nocardioides sp. NPDC057772]|uniref:TOBE domain-containing protein n=1 Tax=Nocardioides sp. NPDC057772 TaxID=3346245 RepID=UPI003671BD3D